MKRVVISGLLVLLLLSLVVAQDELASDIGSGDVEDIQEKIDMLPINDSGEIDYDKFKPFRTKADERIDAINLWLEENASWLKVVFGMVPSITLLFAINFYILLFFIVILILNINITFSLSNFLSRKMDLIFFEISWAQLLGLGFFIILLVKKVFVKLANIFYGLWEIIWNYILPWGFAIAVAIAILFWIGVIFSIPIALRIFGAIRKKIAERKKKREAKKETINREALDKIVEGAIGD